jgi:hypothetical protein
VVRLLFNSFAGPSKLANLIDNAINFKNSPEPWVSLEKALSESYTCEPDLSIESHTGEVLSSIKQEYSSGTTHMGILDQKPKEEVLDRNESLRSMNENLLERVKYLEQMLQAREKKVETLDLSTLQCNSTYCNQRFANINDWRYAS